MRLHTLLGSTPFAIPLANVPNLDITGVYDDSRHVRPGGLFVAVPGTLTDGNRFIADAFARGAVAVATEKPMPACVLPQIPVHDAPAMASILAHAFHQFPARRMKVLAVTGTNGKTTIAYLLRHLLGRLGMRSGMIGTVEIDDGQTRIPAEMTTPGAVQVADLMGQMVRHGCGACAIETSSHALDQDRVAGVGFAAAAFTNLTGDHLDYHKTMDAYAAAKARLFESLDPSAVAVVNAADDWTPRMVTNCRGRIIRYGFTKNCDYRAKDIAPGPQGSQFILVTPDGETEMKLGLVGRHNIENALAAAALVGETFGVSVHQLAGGLKDAHGAPGRLQPVRCGQPFNVLVDYAHTDDALENVLTALRPSTRGKLRVLFGCGGGRDPHKRPRMAKVASRLADALYITSDNPRHEDPDAILAQIVAGLPAKSDKPVIVEPDRRAAIERICADAEEGDTVLLAGKGHENYQIIGAEKRHFDDVEEAARVLSVWTRAKAS